jgi:hypothetical protein
MERKHVQPSQRKPPRPKKLRLVDHSPIGLTDEQRQELRTLYMPIANRPFPPLSDVEGHRQSCFDRCLYIYIEFLCYDAQLESIKTRKRKTANDRRKLLKEMNKLCGRELSPQDIINQLTSHAPLPRFAQDAIRRDYLRITV